MKKLFLRSFAVMLAAMLILAAAVLVRHRKAQLADQPMPPQPPVAVFTKSTKWGRLSVTRHYLGIIKPEAEAILSAQTTGYLPVVKAVGRRYSSLYIVCPAVYPRLFSIYVDYTVKRYLSGVFWVSIKDDLVRRSELINEGYITLVGVTACDC